MKNKYKNNLRSCFWSLSLALVLMATSYSVCRAQTYGSDLVRNGRATLGNLTGWDASLGPTFSEGNFGFTSPDGGDVFDFYSGSTSPEWISQEIDVSSLSADISAGTVKMVLSAYMLKGHFASTICRMILEQVNGSNAVIATSQVDNDVLSTVTSGGTWAQKSITINGLNTSTRKLRIKLYGELVGTDGQSFVEFDGVSLMLYKPATVTTQAVSAIAATTATGNGNITNLGNPNPIAYGICYGTTANPDITGSKVDKGSASVAGAFVASMTGLTANTTYHVRAYATNTAGTSYGNDVTFKTLTPGTWTGNANSSYWTDANNWAGGTVPTSTTDVTIPSSGITYLPMIFATDNAECNNLTLADGFLEILSTSSGTGSLIVHGTASGKVWTDVYLAANQWHVVAPPANNADISSFISYNSNGISSKVNGAATTYAIADYNENGNAWNSYFTDATSGTFTSGKGYSMRHDDDNYIAFYGDLITGNKTVTLTKTGEGWNCIGNPYTSAIGMNSSAGTSSNFLGVNASSSLDPNYACVYVWDPTTTSYKIIGGLPSGLGGERSLGQDLLQAGQGFFVKAASAGASINFTPAMQTHSTGTVLKSAEAAWPGFELTASASGVKASTVVAFNSAMTKGLDPTYDAGLLRASNGLSLYTKLIDDNGVDFAIQCLPENGMENFVIPVGLDAKAGGEVKFNATCTGLPTGSSVILEDRTAKVYTDLSNGADYVVTLSANSSGTGRFYIHTSNLTTGTSDLLPSGLFRLKAYPADGVIWIDGHVSSKAVTGLYDARGSQIGRYNLEEGNRNSIPTSGLTSGVYILKVIDGNNTFATKLVLVSNL